MSAEPQRTEPEPAQCAALGVLFVHGIGEQREGEALSGLGEPLADWVVNSFAGVEVTDAAERPSDGDPAQATLEGPYSTLGDRAPPGDFRWLLTEAWWSEAFHAPSRLDVVKWAAWWGPRTLSEPLRRSIRSMTASTREAAKTVTDETRDTGGVVEYFLLASVAILIGIWLLYSLVAVAAIVLLMLALWAGLLVASLPGLDRVPYFGRAAEWLRGFAVNFVGDTYVLTHEQFGKGSIISEVERELKWLSTRAERIAVIAHSQGAAIAFYALQRQPQLNVVLFVTYGAALRVLTEGSNDEEIDLQLKPPHATMNWMDFYASADVVPAGPLWRSAVPAGCSTYKIQNRRSLLLDHVTYRRNPEQFLAPVAEALANATLGQEPTAPRPANREATLAAASRDRRARTSYLAAARLLHVLGWIAGLLLLGEREVRDIGQQVQTAMQSVGFGIENFLDGALTGLSWWLGAVSLLVAAALLYGVVVLAIEVWSTTVVRNAQRRVEPLNPLRLRVATGAAAALLVVALVALAVTSGGTHQSLLVGFVCAGWLVASVVWLRDATPEPLPPRPQPPSPVKLEYAESGEPVPTLAPGVELAYRTDKVWRHVRVIDPSVTANERSARYWEFAVSFVRLLIRTLTIGDAHIHRVEVLDQAPPQGKSLACGQVVNVVGLNDLVPWHEYQVWCQADAEWQALRRTRDRKTRPS